jgi:hypothetical protein
MLCRIWGFNGGEHAECRLLGFYAVKLLLRTEVSEDYIASITRLTRISELGITLAVTSNRSTLQSNTLLLLPLFLARRFWSPWWLRRYVGSYKKHTASHPRRQHSFQKTLFNNGMPKNWRGELSTFWRNFLFSCHVLMKIFLLSKKNSMVLI